MTYIAETLEESRTRSLDGKPNMGGLKPLTRCRVALRRAVEEATWLGDDERAEAYQSELDTIESKIAKGETYEPEW
jgi:hypothetical protein